MDKELIGSLKRRRELLMDALQAAGAKISNGRIQCPFHEDNHASGGIFERDGIWLFSCRACIWNQGKSTGDCFAVVMRHQNCDFTSSLRFFGIENGNGKQKPTPKPSWLTLEAAQAGLAQWENGTATRCDFYRDAHGKEVMAVIRIDKSDGKVFKPLHRAGNHWQLGDPPGKLPLFGLPDLSKGNRTVFVCEGEKCAEAARSIGLIATTSAHGSQSAYKSDWTPLIDRDCVILPDNDDPGRKYAVDVQKILENLDPPAHVRIVELPGLPKGGDICDWLETRDSVEPDDLRRRIEQLADPWSRYTFAQILDDPRTWAPVKHIHTELYSLDRATGGGFRTRGMHVICGKPGQTKSTVGIQIAHNAAKAGTTTGFFSLELSRDEVAQLITSQATEIPRGYLAHGNIPEGFQNTFSKFKRKHRDMPLTILDDDFWPGGLDRERFSKFVADGVKRFGWRLVVIDYLGLMAAGENDRTDYQTDLLNSTTLRRISKSNDIALVVVSALRKNAKFEKPDNVTLDDVIGAGRICYDAQTVWFVSCEQRNTEPPSGTVTLKCLKSRFTRAAFVENRITLKWYPSFGRICDEYEADDHC